MIDTDYIREAIPISEIIGAVISLKRVGRELIGCCPFHADRNPSLYVSDEKGFYFCHGCQARGDVFRFIMDYSSVDFIEAANLIMSGSAPRIDGRGLPAKPAKGADPAVKALAIWNNAQPIYGTVADLYLAGRGINSAALPSLEALRFDRVWNVETADYRPALIARVSDLRGGLTGIQRTYLTEDGRKLSVQNPKRSMGRMKGGAVKLGPAASDIIMCEGVEDGLSLMLAAPTSAIWAVTGAGMIAAVELPESCHSVVIARDNDEAGQRAAKAAAEAFARPGRTVRIACPPGQSKDWNEQLQSKSEYHK